MANRTASPIRLLALIEAETMTGPAKNLIDFCLCAKRGEAGSPALQVSLATFHRAAASSTNLFVEAAREKGVEVDVIGERFRYDPCAIAELRRVIEQRAPDIVETKSVKSHFLLRLSGMHRRQAWAVFHHGYTATDLKMHAYNQLDRWSLRAADRVITVCDAFARQIASRGVPPDRISVLHNSISPDYGLKAGIEDRRAVRSAHAISDDERVVLTAGRLSQEKAQADLVKAFALLVGRHPEIKARLVIVGDGQERRRIEEAAVSLQVTDRVILAGAASDVPRWYRAADLFALPSLSEGSPNVLLEAMVMELPIVATSVGGVPEIVTHDESALLVGPRDPQAMAEAMARLLTDEWLARRLAANARIAGIRNHSPDFRLRALSAIYCQMVSASTSGSLSMNVKMANR